MGVGAVFDNLFARNWQLSFRVPGIEACGLADLKGLKYPIVGHWSPAKREILWDEIRHCIEAVIFPTEDARRDVVARSRRQCPTTVRERNRSIQGCLQWLGRCNRAIDSMQRAQSPLVPTLP